MQVDHENREPLFWAAPVAFRITESGFEYYDLLDYTGRWPVYDLVDGVETLVKILRRIDLRTYSVGMALVATKRSRVAFGVRASPLNLATPKLFPGDEAAQHWRLTSISGPFNNSIVGKELRAFMGKKQTRLMVASMLAAKKTPLLRGSELPDAG